MPTPPVNIPIKKKHAPYEGRNKFDIVTFTIGAESANTINIALVFKDANGRVVAEPVGALVYLSDVATGLGVTATAPNSGIAIGTNGTLIEAIADKLGLLISNAAGLADITFSESGVVGWYLVVVMPDGSLTVSNQILFA